MDFNSVKVLQLINKYPNEVDFEIILNKSNIPKDDFIEIMHNLDKQDYIRFVGDGFVETTNKGKTYITQLLFHWLTNNILGILALIVSIISLIFSGIALFNS